MKTTVTKKSTTLLGLVMLFINLSAQTDEAKKKMCDTLMKHSLYIFEGENISSEYHHVKTGEYTYANFNSYLTEVKKVIKGNIQKGTIEIIEHADGIIKEKDGVRTDIQQSEKTYMPSGTALFFGFDAAENIKGSNITNSNAKSIQIYDAIPFYNNEIKKDPRGGLTLYFTNLTEFYNYLSTNYSIKMDKSTTGKTEEPPQPVQLTPAQKTEIDSTKQAQNKLLYERRQKNYNQYMEQRMKIIEAQKNKADTTKQTKPK